MMQSYIFCLVPRLMGEVVRIGQNKTQNMDRMINIREMCFYINLRSSEDGINYVQKNDG